MTILNETARLVKDKLASEYEAITVERVMIGVFFSGVKLSDGIAGLSYTPVKDVPQAVCCPSSAGRIFDPFKINGMPAAEVLTALTSNEPIKAAVAIATLNALSAVCWERGLTDDYRIQMDSDAVDAVRMPADRSVAVIGAFVPVLRKLKARGGRWWVIEQDPKTLKGDEINHFIPADQAEEIIAAADVRQYLPRPAWRDRFSAQRPRLMHYRTIGALQANAAAHPGDGVNDQSNAFH